MPRICRTRPSMQRVYIIHENEHEAHTAQLFETMLERTLINGIQEYTINFKSPTPKKPRKKNPKLIKNLGGRRTIKKELNLEEQILELKKKRDMFQQYCADVMDLTLTYEIDGEPAYFDPNGKLINEAEYRKLKAKQQETYLLEIKEINKQIELLTKTKPSYIYSDEENDDDEPVTCDITRKEEKKEEDKFACLLRALSQNCVNNWKELLIKDVSKMGEGVYGEVYKCIYRKKECAMKVIPFNTDFYRCDKKVNGEILWEPQEILPEVVLSTELSKLNEFNANFRTPNFINVLGSHVVKGDYPKTLLKAWDIFDQEKTSENDRPSVYSSKEQHYLALCFTRGGSDLEIYDLKNEEQCISILLQLALSLLIAEKTLEFEHRDLHCSNVLIEPFAGNISYKYEGRDITIVSHGVKANIIDYTLSRLKINGLTYYRDLEGDVELFQSEGDYQFEIYRMMRKENKGDWYSFTRKTNLFWLHYLADYMINRKECREIITEQRKKKLKKTLDTLLTANNIEEFIFREEFQPLFKEYLKE